MAILTGSLGDVTQRLSIQEGVNIIDNMSGNEAAVLASAYVRPMSDPAKNFHLDIYNTNKPMGSPRRLNEAPVVVSAGFTKTKETTAFFSADYPMYPETLSMATSYEVERTREVAFKQVFDAVNNSTVANLFYGNTLTESRTFSGLSGRYNAYSNPATVAGQGPENTCAAYAATDATPNAYTSIYLVTWGEDGAKMIFNPERVDVPNNAMPLSRAGIPAIGEAVFHDQNARQNTVWARCNYEVGLALGNYMRSGRLCNIPVSTIDPINPTIDVKLLSKFIAYLQSQMSPLMDGMYGSFDDTDPSGKPVFHPSGSRGQTFAYIHKRLFTALSAALMDVGANTSSLVLFPSLNQDLDNFGNPAIVAKHILNRILGVPIIVTDAISLTEAYVPAAS